MKTMELEGNGRALTPENHERNDDTLRELMTAVKQFREQFEDQLQGRQAAEAREKQSQMSRVTDSDEGRRPWDFQMTL